MLRSAIVTVSITVSCLLMGPSLASAGETLEPGALEPAKKEAVGKPAERARAGASRSFVGPSRGARDRSWASDNVRRETVHMKAGARAGRRQG